MHPKKVFAAVIVMAFTTPSFAMFCPNGFNQINIGDSIEQVKQTCGAPTSQKESESRAKVPQEWNYFVQVSPTDQATLKTTVALNNGKVTNMSVNGIGVSSTAICNGNNVSVGDTDESVQRACGKPAFITQGNINPAPATKVIEFTYSSDTSSSTLVFENGVLTGTK